MEANECWAEFAGIWQPGIVLAAAEGLEGIYSPAAGQPTLSIVPSSGHEQQSASRRSRPAAAIGRHAEAHTPNLPVQGLVPPSMKRGDAGMSWLSSVGKQRQCQHRGCCD